MIFLAISEQTAATLSAAGFSATLAGFVALIVFGAGQYMTWRLEHTKHLRQKLEELIEAVLEFQDVHIVCPEKNPLKGIAPYDLGSQVGKLRRRIEGIQHVYFPELSKYVGDVLKFSAPILDQYLECYFERAQPTSQQAVVNAVEKLCEAQKKMNPSIRRFLEYIAQDKSHLTRKPKFLDFN